MDRVLSFWSDGASDSLLRETGSGFRMPPGPVIGGGSGSVC
ncbi:hypothetical protein P775_10605 [Puniceibacterium antarcticum]|uniref:Uncharacterized protein n=1 Tax=Puniceibacterium antarcticum TaxID=1206336 RepID=A0A2G8REY8_9RHOB|nr:hypothetical protein [Puniceibacterium antarcticum]PIL20110.1 hypothetical protein P775_10605 [Puniceibacterium antarcticum]